MKKFRIVGLPQAPTYRTGGVLNKFAPGGAPCPRGQIRDASGKCVQYNWGTGNVQAADSYTGMYGGYDSSGTKNLPQVQASAKKGKKFSDYILRGGKTRADVARNLGKNAGAYFGMPGEALEPVNFTKAGLDKFTKDVKNAEKGYEAEERNRKEYEKALKKKESGKMSTDKFAQQYNEKGWANYDPATMKEGYEGQFQDAVDEANARKEANMGVTNTALEFLGGGAGYRVLTDPLGTAKGVAQTVGDVATLPVGLGEGIYNYATKGDFDMGINPLTGANYGEGASETFDALGVIPGIGAAGKLAKFTKNTDLAIDAGKFLTTKTPLKHTYKVLGNNSKFHNPGEVPHWKKGYQEVWDPEVADLDQLTEFQKIYSNKTKIPRQFRKEKELIVKNRNKETIEINKKIKEAEAKGDYELGQQLQKEHSLKADKFIMDLNTVDAKIDAYRIKKYSPFEEELGSGSFGKVFSIPGSNKVVKIGRIPGDENLDELIEKGKSLRDRSNIAIPIRYQKLSTGNVSWENPEQYATVMNKVDDTGTRYNILKEEAGNTLDISNKGQYTTQGVGRGSYEQLVQDIKDLQDSGLYVDFQNTDNILFNPRTGKFNIYDLNTSGHYMSNRLPHEIRSNYNIVSNQGIRMLDKNQKVSIPQLLRDHDRNVPLDIHRRGGVINDYIELDIPESEIYKYINGGYIVEQLDNFYPSNLNRFNNGGSPKSQWIAPAQRYSGSSNVDPTTGLIYKDFGDVDVKAGKKGFKRKVQDFFRKDIGKLTKEAEELGKGVGYIAGVQGDIEPAVYNREGIKKFKSEVKRLKGDFNTELKDAEKKRKQEAADRAEYEKAREKAQNSKDPSASTKFRMEYEKKGWDKFDSNLMKEGYKGQFQDAVDEANARKTENFNLVRDAAAELSGIASAHRVYEDPLGTLKGVGQSMGDITTLPLGLGQGVYNYANTGKFDMGVNPLTGSNYGEGFDETMDAIGVAGLIAPGLSGLRTAGTFAKAGDLVSDVGKGFKTLTKGKPQGSILSKYRNIEELRHAKGYKNFKAANEAYPELFPTEESFMQAKNEANALLKEYKPKFEKQFGKGKDDEILVFGAHDDVGKLKSNEGFLVDDEFAKSTGLENDLTNQQKFLGDTYQLEYSGYFNKNPGYGGNKQFAEYLSNQIEPVIGANKLKAPAQVRRTSSFNRPVKTMRGDQELMLNYDDLLEGDVIYPEHNWSTTTDMTGNVWGSGDPTSKVAIINVPEGQSAFRPNMYTGSQYVDEQELLLPSKLGYKVSGVNTKGFGSESPRFIFDVHNPYKQGGATNDYIELDIPEDKIQHYLNNGYNVEEVSVPMMANGGTPSDIWYQYTGTPWSEAKAKGLTDGTMEQNLALVKRLQAGEFGEPKIVDTKSTPTVTPYDQMVFALVKQGNSLDDLVKQKVGTREGLIFKYPELFANKKNVSAPKKPGPKPKKGTTIMEQFDALSKFASPYIDKVGDAVSTAYDSWINRMSKISEQEAKTKVNNLNNLGVVDFLKEADVSYSPYSAKQTPSAPTIDMNKLFPNKMDQLKKFAKPEVQQKQVIEPYDMEALRAQLTQSNMAGAPPSLTRQPSQQPLGNNSAAQFAEYGQRGQGIENTSLDLKPDPELSLWDAMSKLTKDISSKETVEEKPPVFDNSISSQLVDQEWLGRQQKDYERYSKFMSRGRDIANRTDVQRNVDSEKFFADMAKPNSVIIDIGSALGNSDPKLAGVSVWELTQNPKIKQKKIKVIATDIPDQVKSFKEHAKNKKAYNIDYAEVPMTFNTPIDNILKSKNLTNTKDVYLRAANSIDLLMTVAQTKEHFYNIAKKLKNKNVTYVYNNMIWYKPAGETSWSKIGNINNAAYDHNAASWKLDKNRKPYALTGDDVRNPFNN